jgi:hypothetical protein
LINPTARVQRVYRLRPHGQAPYLSREEAEALLAAIDQESSPFGMRDYALFLMHLTTGQETHEIRYLRWGALEVQGGPKDGPQGKAGRVEVQPFERKEIQGGAKPLAGIKTGRAAQGLPELEVEAQQALHLTSGKALVAGAHRQRLAQRSHPGD